MKKIGYILIVVTALVLGSYFLLPTSSDTKQSVIFSVVTNTDTQIQRQVFLQLANNNKKSILVKAVVCEFKTQEGWSEPCHLSSFPYGVVPPFQKRNWGSLVPKRGPYRLRVTYANEVKSPMSFPAKIRSVVLYGDFNVLNPFRCSGYWSGSNDLVSAVIP